MNITRHEFRYVYSRRLRIAAIVVALLSAGAIVVIAWPRARPFLAIDRCLDAGGCWDWDAERGGCEFNDQARCSPLP
jgi:hypothetical protein